jgi:undecaprenyl-diphosphatase
LAAGFALLSKYTAVLLLPGIAGFLLFSAYRRLLCDRALWCAIGIAFLVFSPVLSWNYRHEWASFQFQLNHGFASAQTINPGSVFEYLGVQSVALNPLFFCLLLVILFRYGREILADEKQAFLLWPCLTVLLFFAYAALFKRVEANWAAPAYVTGIVLVARWFDGLRHRTIYRAGIALGIALILLLKLPEAFGFLPAKLVMKRQVLGYDAMFQSAGPYLAAGELVIAADYKLASLATYYLPGQPTVTVLTPSRTSQYDYWRQSLPIQPGADAVFFGYTEQKAALERLFVEVSPLPPLSYSDRYIERSLQVFRCLGFKPGL